jgi:hypothetical protein
MHKHIADVWIADLEKNPPQAKGTLFNGYGYCCLGRLCVLAGITPTQGADDNLYFFDENSATLPGSVANWAGMKSDNGSYSHDNCLSHDNDGGKTFPEIAQIIRKRWESL